MVNIHITFLAWSVEFVGGLLLIGGTHLLGHENNIVTFSMHTLGHLINFIILPSIYLFSDDDMKIKIIDSSWYNHILDILNLQYDNKLEKQKENANVHNGLQLESHNRDVANNTEDGEKELNT